MKRYEEDMNTEVDCAKCGYTYEVELEEVEVGCAEVHQTQLHEVDKECPFCEKEVCCEAGDCRELATVRDTEADEHFCVPHYLESQIEAEVLHSNTDLFPAKEEDSASPPPNLDHIARWATGESQEVE